MKKDDRKCLVLTRKYGESIDLYVAGEKITFTFLNKHGSTTGPGGRSARISILASENVKILRAEHGEYKEPE